MAKLLKWLLVVVAGILLTVVIAVLAVIILVDPNDYRDDISRLVEENTGQELVIEGEIDLRFFPWLGLDLGRTRLENRPGFGDQPFVQVDNVGIAVQFLPLLQRELVMDVVRLDGLLVHLIVNEQGEANWDMDQPQTGEEAAARAPPEERAPERAPGQEAGTEVPMTISRLAGVQLTNMNLIFEDRQAGSRQEIGPMNVTIGQLAFDRDVPVSADWMATLDPQTRINGELESQLRINQGLDRIRFQLTRLDLTTFADGLPENGLESRLSALLEANMQDETASLSDLRLDSAGLRLNANAEVTQLNSSPRVQGRFDIPEVSLRQVLRELGQEVPETADPDVLKIFSAGAGFSVVDETATVEDLAVRLDDTNLSGSLGVSDFANPLIGFQLVADALNADRYLPPASEEEPEPTPTAEGGEEPVELPMDLLRGLRLDGSFSLGELIITNITLRDVNFTVKADQGRIRVNPVGAKLYGGEYQGDIRVDATGAQAVIQVDERVSNVQAQEIVQQFAGKDLLQGRGNLTLQAKATGTEVMELVRTLAGEANFKFTDGAVFGINLAQRVRSATASLRGGRADAADAADAPQKTDFTEMVGRVTFDGGKIRNESLNAQSPLFRVEGGGVVDMLEQTVDYRLTVNLVGSLTGQGGESLDELRRIPIPLRFQGDLLSPDISLDLAAALSARQRQRLAEEEAALRQRAREAEESAKAELEEEREKVEEKVRDRARDELRKLFQ